MDEKPYKQGSAFRKLLCFVILAIVVGLGTAHAANDLTNGQTARGDREALLVFCLAVYLPASMITVAPAMAFVLSSDLSEIPLRLFAVAGALLPLTICGAFLILFGPPVAADIGICASGVAAMFVTAAECFLRIQSKRSD